MTLYRATEELPRNESPKPCFAPIYTPSGVLITEYRPADHAWHTGLYFGWVHVNDANLWGGAWYLPEKGKYEEVEHSHGVQRHDAFPEVRTDKTGVSVTEQLTWLDQDDQPMVSEVRTFRFRAVSSARGYLWSIQTVIEPVVERLTMGASKAARYSGLELRMGPPFADAAHRSSEGLVGHEQIMGTRARWVCATGATGGAVMMIDHPQNPRHPVTWFTRKNLLGAGLLMSGPIELQRGETLTLRYGLAILDHEPAVEMIEGVYEQYIND
ncbi:MAG: PmoA family protein [Candidatus Latescibacteria bacterium]|nr:PmoA family protein [Candidatus Latescibacterota bacterium]